MTSTQEKLFPEEEITEEERQERFKKLWLIQKIKKDHLEEIASAEKFNGPKKEIHSWLMKLDQTRFDEVIEEYVDAQNSTNYIYLMNPEKCKDKKFRAEIMGNLDRIPPIPNKRNGYIRLETLKKKSDDEIRAKLNYIRAEKIVPYWDFNENITKFQQIDELTPIPVRILFDRNFVIVRSKDNGAADIIVKKVFSKHEDSIKRLKCDPTDLTELLNFIEIIRIARIGYDKKQHMQIAAYTAGNREKTGYLNNLKKWDQFVKEIKEGTLRNCYFCIPKEKDAKMDELKDKDVISIGINFIDGKIYFLTHLTESETIEWITEIIRNIDIGRKFKNKIDSTEF